MKDLSLNILDIAQNSLKAKATSIMLDIVVKNDLLSVKIIDNGSGMSEEFVRRCTDPFVTTRTTRKVGMGLSLLRMLAHQADGDFDVQSTLGSGTTVSATFRVRHIDRSPMGDLAGTMVALIAGAGECDIKLHYEVEGRSYDFSTAEIKEQLNGIDICEPEILVFLGEMIKENLVNINGGLNL